MTAELPELIASRLEIDGRVACLTLARDEVRNELTGSGLAAEIAAVARWANRCSSVSVLVITGEGTAFSAGGNVKDMQSRSGSFAGSVFEVQDRYRRGIQEMSIAMQAIELPTIAAINGAAIGAGLDLACMCDIRLASRTAKMGETFVNLGIIPGDGGAWFLQRLIGYQAAARLTFTGAVIDAKEAMRLGIVSEITEPDELLGTTMRLAQVIAAKPPMALRLTKRLLVSAQRLDLGQTLELSAVFQGVCHNTPEHTEAIAAFLERREPSFD